MDDDRHHGRRRRQQGCAVRAAAAHPGRVRAGLLKPAAPGVALALALLGGAGCAPAPESTGQATERARLAALELKSQLIVELTNALAAGPPEQAVDVCADVAQQITTRLEQGAAVQLRRVALKVRNPLNGPDAYEAAWLARTRAAYDADRSVAPLPFSEVVEAPGGGRELRYLDPILLAPLCTTCHGTQERMPAEVRLAIHRRYPTDKAVNYEPGDLRGAISVRVPLD